MFVHVLLELYCSYKWDEKDSRSQIPEFCTKGIRNPGYHCFENNCKFKAFTYADNEICYAGSIGEVDGKDGCIGFGGDMEPQDYCKEKTKELKTLWESICKKKVQEAYEEFMKLKDK
jgi:hypothetical protein